MADETVAKEKHRWLAPEEILILGVVFLVAVPTGRLLHQRSLWLHALERQRLLLQQKEADLLREQEQLKHERTALLTDRFLIEKEARERLGMQRPGEIMLPAQPEGKASAATRLPVKPRSQLDRILMWVHFPLVFPVGVTLLCALSMLFAQWAFTPESPKAREAGLEETASGTLDESAIMNPAD